MLNIFKKRSKETDLISKQYVGLQEAIDALDKAFPELQVTPSTSQSEVMYRAGSRKVIQWLKQRLEKEQSLKPYRTTRERT